MKTIELKTDLLLGLFIVSLVLANTLGTKIVSLLGARVSVGIFFMPLLFLITDIVAEVHGKQKAKSFVYISVFVLFFTLAAMYVCINLDPYTDWPNQESYAIVFGASLRMTIASVIAFIFSQFHDVWAFHYIKKKTKGRYLWLRNNLSTAGSQLIDTTLFMFIAFYGIAPKFDFMFIIWLIIPYYLFKIFFALIDTPLVYLGVWWLRKE